MPIMGIAAPIHARLATHSAPPARQLRLPVHLALVGLIYRARNVRLAVLRGLMRIPLSTNARLVISVAMAARSTLPTVMPANPHTIYLEMSA